MPCCRAIGDHSDRQIRRMARRVEHLHVEYGGQAAQALRADAEPVHFVVEFDAELFGGSLRPTGDQFLNVDRVHQRLLGQQHGLFARAADADSEHARRAPSRAHGRDGLEHPVHNRVGGIEHGEFALGFRAAALGRDRHLDGVALAPVRR